MKLSGFLISCFICCSFFPFKLSAQNLVVNPGFEEIDSMKIIFSSADDFVNDGIIGWFNPNFADPNYYCPQSAKYYFSHNQDTIHAFQGNAFAGFFAFVSGQYREYLGGDFTRALVSGKKYRFSFYLALSKVSNYHEGQIGVLFSPERIIDKSTCAPMSKYSPKLIIDISNSCKINDRWEEVSGEYTARGGETHFIIGDFRPLPKKYASQLDSVATSVRQGPDVGGTTFVPLEAYYFVDNFHITLANENEIVAGKTIIANNITFSTSDSVIDSNSYSALNEIVQSLKSQPKLKVEIDGHTDNSGTPESNQKLSEARARAVANYFISKGIVPKRIKTKGYGSSKPISTDQNKNRRVEFIFY